MEEERCGGLPWDDEEPAAESTSGQEEWDPWEAWEEVEPGDGFDALPRWDPLWDAFEPYDGLDDVQPEEGDFWTAEDEDEEPR